MHERLLGSELCISDRGRTLSTISNRYGESRQSCLVPNFNRIALSFSPFNLMLVVILLYIAFIMFRYVACIPDLSKTFIMKGCWILSKAFSASNEMIIRFFSFSLFIWWIAFIDFHMLSQPCISGMKPTRSRWMIFLMYSWIRFASILLSIFTSMFMSEIDL